VSGVSIDAEPSVSIAELNAVTINKTHNRRYLMGRNRKRATQTARHQKAKGRRQRLNRIKKYLSNHYLALSTIVLACISITIAVYVVNLEPDIRLVKGADSQTFFSPPVPEESGGCLYYLSVRTRFRNESFKGGYVNNATFTPLTLDLEPKFELVEVDRSRFGRGDEREVEAKFKLSLPPKTCQKVASREDPFKFAVYFYDNTGKLINKNTAGENFVFPSEIRFNSLTAQASRSSD
jgi:hypothetical protein